MDFSWPVYTQVCLADTFLVYVTGVVLAISDDRKFLNKRAKLPPKHTYDAAMAMQKSTGGESLSADHMTIPLHPKNMNSDDDLEEGLLSCAAGISSSIKRQAKDAEITEPSVCQRAKKPKTTAEDGKISLILECNTDSSSTEKSEIQPSDSAFGSSSNSASRPSSDNLASQPPSNSESQPSFNSASQLSSGSATQSSGSMSPLNTPDKSERKSLEKRVARIEKDLQKLRDVVKSMRATEEATTVASKDTELDELLASVKHLSASTEKEVNECVKRLCFLVFEKKELAASSRTGKKTIRSGENVKPALDQQKLQLLERAVLTKCETLSRDQFKKKIDNIIKMERRSDKGSN